MNKWVRVGIFVCTFALAASAGAWAQDPDSITAADVAGSRLHSMKATTPSKNAKLLMQIGKHQNTGTPSSASATTTGITGIDSLINFSGDFMTPGFDPNGKAQDHWFFNSIGNRPELGGTTTLDAPIVPVFLDLRDVNGMPRFVRVNSGSKERAVTCGVGETDFAKNCHRLLFDPTPFIAPVLESPVYSNTAYTSSDIPTQFADAVGRAEYQIAAPDWHTLLAPSVKNSQTMVINQDPRCGAKGTAGHCNYLFALNPDGSCCFFVLIDVNVFENGLAPSVPSAVFPPPSTTPVGAAEAAGDIKTQSVSNFFFPPAFLFFQTPQGLACCIGGFHTIDVEPGDANNGNLPRVFVLAFTTWDVPIFVDPNIQDVTGLSHEISEIYNDPFVAALLLNPADLTTRVDITPWWLAPNGLCQDSLEVGDVIEGIPNAESLITMPVDFTPNNLFTYHPQNEALLQWFEFQSPSTALNGAFSYPDVNNHVDFSTNPPTVTSVPTLAALSTPQKAGCKL